MADAPLVTSGAAGEPSVTIEDVPAAATHDLRRRVLRAHRPADDVDYPTDRAPGALHLGARVGGVLVAVASVSPEPAPGRDGGAHRLRGMAVDPDHQGRGIGGLLVEEAAARLRAAGVPLLWANARSSALGFYEAHGFTAEGEEFESVGLPHRVVVRPLTVDPDDDNP